jgi:hypothetical protein
MVILLKGGIHDVCRSDGFMSHDIVTKFHENW